LKRRILLFPAISLSVNRKRPEAGLGLAAFFPLFRFLKNSVRKVLLPAFLVLVSCGAFRPPALETASGSGKPKILFLVFDVSEDSLQKTTSIVLRSRVVRDGEIKQPSGREEISPNYLRIAYYENGKLQASFNLEHPLYKRVEYFDGSKMVSGSVRLNKSDFFIRLPTRSDSGKIFFYEKKGNHAESKLQTIQI
jgi:hypothetical protein